MSNFDLVMESDLGTFTPLALQFTGSDAAQKVLKAQHCHTIISIYSGLKVRNLQITDSAMWRIQSSECDALLPTFRPFLLRLVILN